ncbi:MAG: glycerol-3-phosphate responsive antiterminator [Mogibacterium sp.]|nr:glycerol-3-phosphate responsive antiterminator [Mogibacterium sp.]
MSSVGFTKFYESLERCPIIAGVNNDELLERLGTSSCEIAYILYGDICNIHDIVDKVISYGKIPVVHIDLVNGLASREISVDFIKKYTNAAGIISTKPHLIKRGNELDLITIQRFFMLDRTNYHNIKRHVKETSPDIVEVMPAGLTKMIEYVKEEIGDRTMIASGLVVEMSYVTGALSAGAIAISTTNTDIWDALD